ncbi:MAG TPA: PhoPQ-activated protein PqaA family protein [Verrucomicrobiae bacterium]|nr:PhoPQ-activated protein PqaA family protein [Verrucomicrobiae bacterium]
MPSVLRINSFLSLLLAAALYSSAAHSARAGALENYVQLPDDSYTWKPGEAREEKGFTITRLELVSQKWRDLTWTHHLIVVRPKTVRNPDIALLLITGNGNGDRQLETLETLASQAGAVAAVITQVPNQPLFDGKSEDALIAYTFSQYLATRDATWPVLFPMVKSAVRGMDAVRDFAQKQFNQKIERFVVTGASKRGWTSWLTAAVDPRVAGVAPMVIDVLNMKAQTEWQRKVYGVESEKIKDYKNANLMEHMDDPKMVELREWVDPYSYRARYTMPKLLLLGTNDPYWTVDSLRHYWNDLPGPKLLFQTPNAGHDLNGGHEATQTLAAFYEMIADHKTLPKMDWSIEYQPDGAATVKAHLDCPAQAARLWTATSTNRDFRPDRWTSQPLTVKGGSAHMEANVKPPANGYKAFLIEADLVSPTGAAYKLSTEARVNPDTVPEPVKP